MAKYEELQGKRVVITGGASGIGLAAAKRFTKEGAEVVIFDWNESSLCEALKCNQSLAGGVRVDVSSPEDVKDGFLKADEIIGGVDILISNAGISSKNLVKDLDFEQWSMVMNINLSGMFLCSKEALSRMEKQKSGVILFTASTNGIEPHPYYADYNASKAGVISLGKTLALEYSPYIRVNSVCPGYVLPPMQNVKCMGEMPEKIDQEIPMKRPAAPEEVASLFAFLASDEAAYITGQYIYIDGGKTI